MKKQITFQDGDAMSVVITHDKTYNKGVRYLYLIEQSLKQLGLCRSIVVDKCNNILCGTKTAQMCHDLGIKRARIIETKGDELIIVKRVDVEPDSTKAHEISLTDNLIASKNLEWNADCILDDMHEHYSFDARKYEGYECIVKELDIEQFLKDEVLRQSRPTKKETKNISKNETLLLFD